MSARLVIEHIQFMGSTTIHGPDELLQQIDAIARRRGVSCNRGVLTEATREMEEKIVAHRQNRGAVVL